MQVGSHIVVGRSTPEVRSQFSVFFQHRHAIYIVSAQETVMLIEVHAEILSFDDQIIDVIIFNGRNDSLNVHLVYILQIQFRSIVRADRQLVFGYRITGRQQCFRFFQLKGHIQQEFFAFANALCAIIQFYGLGLLRSYFQVFDHACLNHFAVSQQFPFCIVTV